MRPEAAVEKDIVRGLIGVVLKQSIDFYGQRLKKERARLHDIEFQENEKTFSILGHLELFSDAVAGIATSIVKTGNGRNHHEALNLLKSNNIFRFLELREWFFTPNNTFPEMRIYIELVDYLRRLCLDYLDGV